MGALVRLRDLNAYGEVVREAVLVNGFAHAAEGLWPFVLAGERAGEPQYLDRVGLDAYRASCLAMFLLTRIWSSKFGSLL